MNNNKLDTIADLYLTAVDDNYDMLTIHELFANTMVTKDNFSGNSGEKIILNNEQKLFMTGVKAYIESPTTYNLNNLSSIISMARNLHDYTTNGIKGSNLEPFSIDTSIKTGDIFYITLNIKDRMTLTHLYTALIVLSS